MELGDLGSVPGGTSGVLGALVAAVGGGIWFVRKILRNDKVDGAEASAQIDIIQRLSEELVKAHARADQEAQRADRAFNERNDAMTAIGELKATVAKLTAEVAMLRERLDEHPKQGADLGQPS